MSVNSVHTLHTYVPYAGIADGFFDADNVQFIQDEAANQLLIDYNQHVRFDTKGVKNVMSRVVRERNESVPRMNQRAIMYLTHEFRLHQKEANKHLLWETNFFESQQLYDRSSETVKYDPQMIKLANRLGKPKVGGTFRFYFT